MIEKCWDDYPNLINTSPFNYNTFMNLCSRESKIIDIGCGYGRICEKLEGLGYRNITGLDISEIQLYRARNNLKYTQLFLVKENEPFQFNNLSFDCLIALEVIDCFLDSRTISFFINECTRILNYNGYWFINFYTRNDSEYFDTKYKDGINEFGLKRVFRASSGIKFKHHSLLEFINLIDPNYDVIKCEQNNFLSFNHKSRVKGYSLILKKLAYKSEYR